MKLAITFFASSLALAAAQDMNLYETVAADAELSTLATAIGLAQYQDYFSNTSDLTVFAPSNSAFETLDGKYLTPGFILHLQYLLNYHVIEGAVVASSDITDGQSITMKNGENITASITDQGVFLSGAAFQQAQLLIPDITASNGIGQVVGGFFLPELLTIDLLTLAGSIEGFGNVIDLVAAAGLEEEFKADNRTILAPSNAAFDALPSDYLQNVASDTELLGNLLRYHLIIGTYPREQLTDGMEVMTVLDVPLTFSVVGGGRFAEVTVMGVSNNATISGSRIAANGIAHTIEGVLEPPTDVTPAPVVVVPTAPTPPTPDGTAVSPAPAEVPSTPTEPTTPTAPTTTESSSAFTIGSAMAAIVSVAAVLL